MGGVHGTVNTEHGLLHGVFTDLLVAAPRAAAVVWVSAFRSASNRNGSPGTGTGLGVLPSREAEPGENR